MKVTACLLLYCGLFVFGALAPARAKARAALRREILVFIPAYEGSALFDPGLARVGEEGPCVWGSAAAARQSDLFFSLRMPNQLIAKPLLISGPTYPYQRFIDALTHESDQAQSFLPYTQDRDFFVFNYDWRQDINTVTAPELARAMRRYAVGFGQESGIPADKVSFVIIAHGMGGLVARTMVSQQPALAKQIEKLYLVGPPNLGTVKAIRLLLVGPGATRESEFDFPGGALKFLSEEINPLATRLIAITQPSLYELLPIRDPQWVRIDQEGHSTRVSQEDLLTVGTWRPYWPSPEAETREFLAPYRNRYITIGEHDAAAAWEFCQDPGLGGLQRILALTREWRLQIGTLSYTSSLLTLPGESTRLRLVVGCGLQTPTGVISEGEDDATRARYTYDNECDGDDTVSVASAIEDLDRPGPGQVLFISGIPHGMLMSCDQILEYFHKELSAPPPKPKETPR